MLRGAQAGEPWGGCALWQCHQHWPVPQGDSIRDAAEEGSSLTTRFRLLWPFPGPVLLCPTPAPRPRQALSSRAPGIFQKGRCCDLDAECPRPSSTSRARLASGQAVAGTQRSVWPCPLLKGEGHGAGVQVPEHVPCR